MKHCKKTKDFSGFTYIELLITLAIIAVLFVPIMRLFSSSIFYSSILQDTATATNLAEWQMERLKNLNITKDQLRQVEDSTYPPLEEEPLNMNEMKWRIKRVIIEEKDPVEVRISVYKEGEDEPVITLVTLIEDTYWQEIQPIK